MTENPPSTTVECWLPIARQYLMADRVLLRRRVTMAHLPGEGDAVEITSDGDVVGYVNRRWWDFEGRAFIEFRTILIDPADNNPKPGPTVTYWHTEHDGDPIEVFESSGWRPNDAL
jgi:hypothetical protein